MNLIFILTLMKLIFLIILLGLDQIYIYKKIFFNEQYTYNANNVLALKLLELSKHFNQEIQKYPYYGFLPDDLSIECQNGINVYKIILDNRLYTYWGMRSNISISNNTTQQQTVPYELIKINHQDPHSVTLTNLAGNYIADQIFFFDNKNSLWKYDIAQNQMLLINSQANSIDYIVGSSLTINTNYFIYLRCREPNNTLDLIKLIIIDHKNNMLITPLISVPIAHKFFLRANNLIFLYIDAEPQIYKLIYTSNQLLAKKIQVPFNTYERFSNKLPSCDLLWDQNKYLHTATIVTNNNKLKIYEFNLPEDNGILSIRTNDY